MATQPDQPNPFKPDPVPPVDPQEDAPGKPPSKKDGGHGPPPHNDPALIFP
jgi:hypothetical protein